MSRIGIVHHPLFQEHDAGPHHPESPQRLKAIEKILASVGHKYCIDIEPHPAEFEEITTIHSPAYTSIVESTKGKPAVRLDMDTQTSARSYEAALLASGGLNRLVEEVYEENIDCGFAFVRPPGHHAEADRGMGFCLFNNVAIAARYALDKMKAERVMIIDWDLHHGNGTQHSFEDDDRVLYFSTHQYPYYPGTGAFTETGRGKGEGYTVNLPLGTGYGDKEYIQIMNRVVSPLAREYKPDIILVSAGFDIHYNDPLGGMEVTPEGFAAMAGILNDLARDVCKGRLVFTLEGGYNVSGQAESILAIIKELYKDKSDKAKLDSSDSEDIEAVKTLKKIQSKYWSCFKENN